MRRILAACLVASGSQAVLAQASVIEREMPAFPAICYRGAGAPHAIDQSTLAGLYAEVRNQGQANFAPRLWVSDPLPPPYEVTGVTGPWQLCQELAAPASKPVGQPYVAIDRPAWRAALLACAEKSDDRRSICLKSLLSEMEKRKYGMAGAPSMWVDGSSNYVVAPIVPPPPPLTPSPISAPIQSSTTPSQTGEPAK
jgi:hypothetical protein